MSLNRRASITTGVLRLDSCFVRCVRLCRCLMACTAECRSGFRALQVRNVVTTCLEKILVERAPFEACEYVKGVIADLLMNKLDLSLLVISKVRAACSMQHAVQHACVCWPTRAAAIFSMGSLALLA